MIDHLYIKRLAAGAGFDLCGIAPCRHLAENEALFRAWLARGRQSSLGYLERNVDKRFDARRLVEGARTAVVCAVSYKNRVGEGYPPGHRTKVASYACAADYHATLRTMLGGMLDALRAAHPGLGGRAFVDTAPLAEKQLAVEAGLGWIGRAVAARHAPVRIVRPAGRTGARRGLRSLRRAARRRGVRLLPPLRRSLPDGCRLQRPRDRCAPLHLLSYDRTDAGRGNCPRRVDFRLRRLPEPLPLQPPCAAASSSGVRSAVRSLVVPARTVARDGGGGIPHVVRPHAAHAQRPPAPPSQCGAKPAPKGMTAITSVECPNKKRCLVY